MSRFAKTIRLTTDEALDILADLDEAIDRLAETQQFEIAAKVSSARAIIFHKTIRPGPQGGRV